MEEIQNALGQNDVPLFFYNRCTSVDDQDLIGEAFDSEDAVTVWAGAPPLPEEEERSRVPKNLKNNSDHEIIVVAHTNKGLPIFLRGNQVKAVKFDFWAWTKIIELYRYLYNTINGGKFYLIFINLTLMHSGQMGSSDSRVSAISPQRVAAVGVATMCSCS